MNEIKKLARTFMFDFKEEELELIDKSFKEFKMIIKKMDKIDTSNVKAMERPFENHFAKLREDETFGLLTTKEALTNAPEVRADQVVVPKVVK